MSLIINRVEGETTFIDLQWKDSAGNAVNISTVFSSIDLLWERPTLILVTLPVQIDDGPNGLGHFEPTAPDMVPGNHFLRIKAVVTASGEIQFFPKNGRICLIVDPKLKSNT